MVRVHHIYKEIWTPELDERLLVETENDNSHDARAVAVTKGGVVVGHLPREAAKRVWYFLNRGGVDFVQ